MTDSPRNNPARDVFFGMTPDEAAALYVVGALSAEETSEFELRLRARDEVYVKAFANVKPVMGSLLDAAAPVAPPSHVFSTLMSRIESEKGETAPSAAPPAHVEWEPEGTGGAESESEEELVSSGSEGIAQGIRIFRASTGRWRRTGLSGVRMRTLLADRRANRRTVMLEMTAGSELPDHSHAGIEEVFVVSGDLHIAGTVLGPGDYIRIDQGADHGIPRTEKGCVCIVISDYVPFPITSFIGFVWTAIKSLFMGGRKHS